MPNRRILHSLVSHVPDLDVVLNFITTNRSDSGINDDGYFKEKLNNIVYYFLPSIVSRFD